MCFKSGTNGIAIDLAPGYYVCATTYCSRFGTFGNDLHLPSADKLSLGLVFGMHLAPVVAVTVKSALIKKTLRDAMMECNGNGEASKTK